MESEQDDPGSYLRQSPDLRYMSRRLIQLIVKTRRLTLAVDPRRLAPSDGSYQILVEAADQLRRQCPYLVETDVRHHISQHPYSGEALVEFLWEVALVPECHVEEIFDLPEFTPI